MAASSEDTKIRGILRASNFFDMLQLGRPHTDLLGQPVWDVTDESISRAYRKLSLCCHPDKSQHVDAPRAFEALKKAKSCLLNPLERDDYLTEFVKKLKTQWEGNWGGGLDVKGSKERVTTMRDEAQREQGDSVAEAMRERHARAMDAARRKQRKQAAAARAEVRECAANGDKGDSDDDNADADADNGRASHKQQAGVMRAPVRKRPKFL